MKITDLISEACVKTSLESEDKEELFEEMVDLLVRSKPDYDRGQLIEAVEERESKMSTGIGNGIAIPHCKTDAVSETCGVIGTSRSGIDYESLDGEPVYIVFMLIGPVTDAEIHLKALQQISILMQDRGLYQRLLETENPGELFRILRQEEDRLEREA